MRIHAIILSLLSFCSLTSAQSWQLATPKYHTADAFVIANNVKDFGAKGDGSTDDTKAIQDALDALRFGKGIKDKDYNAGGVVFIPEGKYVIKKSITIPKGVTLRGEWEKPEKGKTINGTILMSYVGKHTINYPPTYPQEFLPAPLLMLESCSAVMDLSIWYPEQDPDAISPYSPAICLGSLAESWNDQATSARNITLVNAYDGVVVQRKHIHEAANPAVYNIYGTPLHTGVEIDCISDVGRVERIDFSPDYWSGSGLPGAPTKGSIFENYLYENATGILMMRNDWSYTCFVEVEGYSKGFHSSASVNSGVRGPNGHNYEMTFRNCKNGVYLSGVANSGIMFTRTKTENCENGFAVGELKEQSSINLLHIDNCDIDATKNAIVSDLESKAYITLYQTKIRRGAVDIKSGSFVSTDADYSNEFPHINIGSVARAVITGNRFTDPSQIVNQSLFECVIDHTPMNLSKMPDVHIANPDEYRQKPDRLALYVVTDTPFNAKGDALTDNTTAIQSALDKAATEGGGIVYLPPGKYKVLGNLRVPTGVELKGSTDLRTNPGTPGSTLEVYADRNNENGTPFLQLEERSGIRGIIFNYPEQVSSDLPNIGKYPYTIQGLGKDIYIVNIGFRAAYKGIDLFSYPCDNFYVDYVGGHTFKVGTKIGGNSENGMLANWQFNGIYYTSGFQWKFGQWPNSIDNEAAKEACGKYTLDELDFLIIDDCKHVTLYNNFGYGSQRGTTFTSSTGTGASGIALGHAVDGSRRAFCFESVAPEGFTLINSQIVSIRKDASDRTACYIETSPSLDGKGSISMFSCNYWGATNKALNLNGGTLNLYLSNFVNTGETGFAQISGKNTRLNMLTSVIRPRNPLLTGVTNEVSVQSSIVDAQGLSTQQVALWKNNLSFYSVLNPAAMKERTGWIASASINNGQAANALDGNADTRWSTVSQNASNGAWFMVDMLEAWKFNKIILEHVKSPNDFPEGIHIYTSNDGIEWGEAVYSGKGMGGGTIIIGFEEQTARYIKLELESAVKTQFWSVHEFYAVYDGSEESSTIFQVPSEPKEPKVWIKEGKLYLTDSLKKAIISVYSVSGQLLLPSTEIQTSMDIHLVPGIYLVTIKKVENQSESDQVKIVVR